jgi:hypothetical protein
MFSEVDIVQDQRNDDERSSLNYQKVFFCHSEWVNSMCFEFKLHLHQNYKTNIKQGHRVVSQQVVLKAGLG